MVLVKTPQSAPTALAIVWVVFGKFSEARFSQYVLCFLEIFAIIDANLRRILGRILVVTRAAKYALTPIRMRGAILTSGL